MEMPVRYVTRLEAKLHRALIKSKTVATRIRANTSKPELAIIGAYNTSNIGDLALAKTLTQVGSQMNLSPATYYYSQWETYPNTKNMIIGGGGILHQHSGGITRIANQRSTYEDSTVIVGVSGELSQDELRHQELDFLKNVAHISTRSKRSQENMSSLTNRDDIKYFPDLAFALPKLNQKTVSMVRKTNAKFIVGISVLPHLISLKNHRFVANTQPSEWFVRYLPDLAKIYSNIGPSYINFIQKLVQTYIDQDYEVRILHFTIEDYIFACVIFNDFPIKIKKYDPSPLHLMDTIATCDKIIATRYHAHIFALSLGIPVTSIAYAHKCSDLWNDLNLSNQSQISMKDIVLNQDMALSQVLNNQPEVLDSTKIEEIQLQSIESCRIAYNHFIH